MGGQAIYGGQAAPLDGWAVQVDGKPVRFDGKAVWLDGWTVLLDKPPVQLDGKAVKSIPPYTEPILVSEPVDGLPDPTPPSSGTPSTVDQTSGRPGRRLR